MGSGGGGDGGAGQARADEQARQARIRAGTQNINNIFDGYTKRSGVNPVDTSSLSIGNTYYLDDGTQYRYAGPPPKYTGPDNMAQRANFNKNNAKYAVPDRLFSNLREEQIDGQFDEDFYNERQQNYLDYATPQLNDQYEDAARQLTFALDRSGMLQSSVRAKKEADLRKKYNVNRQQVADQGLNFKTQAKNSVEDARANLIATLNATGDTEGAVKMAMTRAQALSAPDNYSPLGQMFSSFTGALGQQADVEKQAALASQFGGTGGASLFNRNKNAVRVTG